MKSSGPKKTVVVVSALGLCAAAFAAQSFLSPQFLPMLAGNNGNAATSLRRLAQGEKGTDKRATFLTCASVRDRVRDFLRVHYKFRKFDEELSTRTYQKYFQALDPGKNFFTQADIDQFKEYEKTLGEHVQKVDCRFISDVYDVYLKRVSTSIGWVDDLTKQPFDFTTAESVETDRKKIPWAKSSEELKDRWRKLLKFFAMNMKEDNPDNKNVNQRLQKRYAAIKKAAEDRTADDVNGIFLNAFALALDPHSQYLMPEDQDEFKVAFSLQLVGIGASLSQLDGYTTVEAVIPGGAAARDGRLTKGDKIVAVDPGDGSGFQDVIDMELNKVVQLIRGKKETPVKIKLLRKSTKGEMTPLTLELVRDVVHLADGEAHSDIMNIDGKRIGVINLPSFYIDYQGSKDRSDDYRSSARDMLREVEKLKKQNADGIVVDLRRDGGGDLNECIRIAGLFIDKGTVVQVQGRDGDVESLDDKDDDVAYRGPLALVISRQSASASEILAGAIQDYGRGLILGNSTTYGKGTVQNVIEIPGSRNRDSDGAIKVTISKFFRPSGKSNQAKGVLSDVVIPGILEGTDISENENDFVLPYSTIQPSKNFRPYQDLSKIDDSLKKKSDERVKANTDFKKIFEAIEKMQKERENTLLSLKATPTPAASATPGAQATNGGKKDKKGTRKDKSKTDVAAVAPATPAATPTVSPLLDPDAPTDPNVVIRADDVELKEAAHILVDSMGLLGNKKDWTKESP